MAMCDACAVLSRGDGAEEPHENLTLIDEPSTRQPSHMSEYRCGTCGTEWRHIDNGQQHSKAWIVVHLV
jgi:hypothetical protein